MIKVNVLIENKAWRKHIRNPNSYLNSKLKKVEKKISIFKKNKLNFTLLLSGDSEIKKLNKKFRKKNKVTDILSFPLQKKVRLKNKSYLGDIIISYNFMDKPKNQEIKLFKDKVIKTFIHGFLHLLGFDHIQLKDYKKMNKEEQKIYQSVIKRIY